MTSPPAFGAALYAPANLRTEPLRVSATGDDRLAATALPVGGRGGAAALLDGISRRAGVVFVPF